MKKKLVALGLSIVIGAMGCMPVLAAARTYTCDVCGRGTVYDYYTNGPETVSKSYKCPDYPYGEDIEYQWSNIHTLKCDLCEFGYSDPPVTFTRVECKGRNTP